MRYICALLLGLCALDAFCALSMHFDGNLQIQGLARQQTASSRRPIEFVQQGGVKIGPLNSVAFRHEGKLNAQQGTLVLRLMPLDWSGGDNNFQFFFHCRNYDDRSVVMLESATDGKLTFLIGFLHNFSKVAIDISDWRPGVRHQVQANWNEKLLEMYVDGKLAGSASRRQLDKLNIGEMADLGGNIFAPSKGDSALSYLLLSPEMLPVQSDIPDVSSSETDKPNSLPRNIATAEYGAVMLPSSQWNKDKSLSIEQAMDGNMQSYYLSGKDDGEHWIELRWPQPVKVDGVQAMAMPPYNFISYAVRIPLENSWKEVLKVETELERPWSLEMQTTDTLRFYFQDQGQLGLRELCVSGEAPRRFLAKPSWRGFFIWYPEPSPNNVVRYFRKNFRIASPEQLEQAWLQICCDDAYMAYVNGVFIGAGGFKPQLYDLTAFLREGHNSIAVRAQEFSIAEGLLAELSLLYSDGKSEHYYTDTSWKAAKEEQEGWNQPDFGDSAWPNAQASENLANYAQNLAYRYFGSAGAGFRLQKLSLSSDQFKPGAYVEIEALLAVDETPTADYGFRLSLGEEALNANADYAIVTVDALPAEKTSSWEIGKPYQVTWNFNLPAWAPHGEYPLQIRAMGAGTETPVRQSDASVISIKRFEKTPELRSRPIKSSVEKQQGQMRIIIDGEAIAAPIFTVNSAYSSFRLLGEGGKIKSDLYRFSLMSGDFYPSKSDDAEAFYRERLAMIDQDIGNFLKIYPEANILCYLTFRPGAAWNEEYPDEVAMFLDGEKTKSSFSSQVWLDMSAEWIHRLVPYLLQSKYAGHIAGFQFGIGDGAEAMYWGRGSNTYKTPREDVMAGDFSPAAIKQFRLWLRQKYGNDVARLRQAWKKPELDFDTAMPDMAELRREEQQNFRNPASGSMAMDYWLFHGDSMANAAIRIAEEFKKACNNQLLVGVYGFYNLAQLHLGHTPAKSHHVAYTGFERVLKSQAIDFLAGIQSYAGVRVGTPVITGMPDACLAQYGKIYIEEFDMRTFFTDLTYSHSHTTSQNETLNVMRRNFGETLVRNNQCWFYGFAQGHTGRRSIGWYSEQSIIEELNRFNRIGRACRDFPNHSTAEVALFVNPHDIVTMDIMDGPEAFVNTQYNTVYRELKTLAVPYDCYIVDNFTEELLEPYKVIIVLDAFYLSADKRRDMRRILEKQGKTVLWLYASGYSDPEAGLSLKHIEELTGFKLGMQPEFREKLAVQLNDGTEFAPYRYPYARRKLQVGPIFYVDDAEAEPLGVYKHSDAVAIARKQVGGMSSIYCASPLAGKEFLRKVLKQSKVHFYSDQPMYMNASSRFVTVHAMQDINVNISLPNASAALNLYTGERLGSSNHLPLALKRGESALFFLGNESEVNKLLERINLKKG
ncbi:MAG TPA: hypothetical protein PKY10_03835 [Lentisphaeria bacterium]|nr:hypothetical protein [Lentisphaeria bacterium]